MVAGLEVKDALSVIDCGVGLLLYPGQEVGEPPEPVAMSADTQQSVVVFGPASLEEGRDVQER